MMMGFSEMLVALLFTMFGGTSGNEALDYIDSQTYFKSKGIEITVESMMLEAKKPDIGEDAFAKEASVRRLLAIRTLGELKNQKAMPVLVSFVESKEMFVSHYAQRAIAKLSGKPQAGSPGPAHWKANLPLLPKGTGVVVNLELSQLKGKAGLMHKFKALAGNKKIEDMVGKIEKGMIEELYPVIDRIGNIRIDSITLAIAENVGDDIGWVTGILNGKYDKQAIMNYINQEMADEMDLKKVGAATYFQPEEEVAFAFQDDNTVNFSSGPSEDLLPLSEIQNAIDTKNQTIKFSDQLQKLIQKTSKKGNLWASGIVSGEMLNAEYIKEFETFRLETEMKGEAIIATLIGDGKDAKAVKETMATLEKTYTNFKDNDLKELKAEMPKSIKPMITAYETMQFKTNDKEGIITLEFPNIDPVKAVFEMFMGIAGEFEEDLIQPAPVPQPKFIPAK